MGEDIQELLCVLHELQALRKMQKARAQEAAEIRKGFWCLVNLVRRREHMHRLHNTGRKKTVKPECQILVPKY